MLARTRLTQIVAQVLVLALVLGLLPAPAQAALPSPSSVPAAPPDLPSSASVPAVLLVAVAIADGAPCAVVIAVATPSDPINYHRARWLDPRVGRFTRMDPFAGDEEDPRTLHRYLYGGNDPANMVDPSGEDFLGTFTSLAVFTTIATIAVLSYQSVVGQGVRGAKHISDNGIRFIARHEGFRSRLYNDAATPPNATIGYGHLVHYGPINGTEAAEFRAGISRARAEHLLRGDAADAEEIVAEFVTVPLKQNEFDALVSFTFNIGTGLNGFRGSTLLRRLNNGDYVSVPGEMMRWVFAGGRQLPGLVNRRRDEGQLFSRGIY